MESYERSRAPREDVLRAWAGGYDVREVDGEDDGPVLSGHFAVFNEWTEIDSWMEGHFLERIAPGAFKKTLRENRDDMKVLFQHGQDPSIGSKVLGPIRDLREDDMGAFYEVPLLDTDYVRSLLPGLRKGLYGASFRFQVMREAREEKPEASDHNPNGLPERTIKEAKVMEFGPVTFPAYADATAGARSLTDRFTLSPLVRDLDVADRLAEALARAVAPTEQAPEPSEDSTPDEERRSTPKPSKTHYLQLPQKEMPSWHLR